MKKLVLFYLLLAATLFACSGPEESLKEEMPESSESTENVQEDEYCTVSLNLNLEDVSIDVSQEPLTKAVEVDSNDLYVINIYEGLPGEEHKYEEYAYGTFNRWENLELTLKKGIRYYFRVTFIKDAKQKLYWLNDSTYYWGASSDAGKVLNRLVLGSWNHTGYLVEWQAIYLAEYKTRFSSAPIDRYYGEKAFYPVENGNVTIDLYRGVFGARFNVTGLTTGALQIEIRNAPEIKIYADSIYSPDNMYQIDMISLTQAIQNGTEATTSSYVSIDWINDAGDRSVEIYSKSVTFTRLKRTIFNISLNMLEPVFWENTVGVSIEDVEIVDDEVIEINADVELDAEQ